MTQRTRPSYRELIHEVNRRYHREWQRAEQLQRDLDAVHRWVRPVLGWLRRCKRWLWPGRSDPEGRLRPAASETFDEAAAPPQGRVSIIIPFKDRAELLRGCLRSIRASTHADRELILVDNGSSDPALRRWLRRMRRRGRAVVVRCPGPFNFSWLCNEGARRAAGDYLLFLNNDTEVLNADWLERLLRLACLPRVGIVGATLLYPDGTVQHAGLHPVPGGRWVHAHRGRPADDPGEHGDLQSPRAVPGVTGACLMIRRELFWSLGGFDERLPVTYGDVELCCRIRARGLQVVVTPHARLLHFEGMTRGFAPDEPGTAHLAEMDRFPAPGRAP
jgi:GT2 family glycosyltransferase